eukprot:scaffold16768_cov117-Isochrysis_galbana.AAC.8
MSDCTRGKAEASFCTVCCVGDSKKACAGGPAAKPMAPRARAERRPRCTGPGCSAVATAATTAAKTRRIGRVGAGARRVVV